jgi:hypothetical protein
MDFDKMQPVTTGASEESVTKWWPTKDTKEGEIVTGVYIGKFTTAGNGRFGESTTYKLKGDKEVYGVKALTVINTAFQNMPQGTTVGIRYNGKKDGKNGTQYKDFEVRVAQAAVSDNVKAVQAVVPGAEPVQLDLTEIPFD